ncbi:MAG: adenylate/guanylate cyclase domain-containing protein [Candidatus Thermoplasmatota archaeon]|nr:adenylate/guanylate cyclase domain-containing protein [Candidatus Thermoplasmatota archaeon]
MKPGLLKSKLAKTLLVTFCVALLVIALFFIGFLGTWEDKISDALYTQGVPLDEIVIVEIDDESLQALDAEWPLPRDYYASVIDALNTSTVIGIDIEFFTNTSVEEDAALGDAIARSGNVVLAMKYEDFTLSNGQLSGQGVLIPIDRLGVPGTDFTMGFVNVYEESDGVVRYFIPHLSGVEDHDHFSVAMVEQYLGFPRILDDSRMLINYYAQPGGYPHVRFSDVYFNTTEYDFTDKIVLIGVTTHDAHDFHAVPISNEGMAGVEIHANLIQSMILQDYLYTQDSLTVLCVILLFAFLTGVFLYRFKVHIATMLIAIVGIAYVVAAISIFDAFHTIMNVLYPMITLISVYVGLVVVYFRTEEKSRKWITSVFGKYVSPVVIDHLLKHPDKIKLGGEKRNMTIFFSDIRGFTPISEQLKPEELVHLLNEYLTEMTSIIINNQGLVDKFMGDAIMAFWGAPLDLPNHADIACSSSLQMMETLRQLQQKWKEQGIPVFDIGIGLNSGEAIVGNMGSATRFDYTAIGDNVNLASRMEGLNKVYGTKIIMTEHTQVLVHEQFETRKLDAVKVKGKKKPIFIYELVCRKGEISQQQREAISHYEQGLELYFKKQWDEAIQSFETALTYTDDVAARLLRARCQDFLKHPPAHDWDGVWTMQTK